MKYLKRLVSSLGLVLVLAGGAFAQTPAPTPTPTPVHVRKAWYFSLQPIANGPITWVGPWWDYAVAADILGSMLYYHPFACHITGPHPPANCRNLGNGMAYLAGTEYPPLHQIPSSGPVLRPVADGPHMFGWYGLYYDNDGTAIVFPRLQRPKYKVLVNAGKGKFPLYKNMACPVAPNFLVGSRLGQQDYACN